MITYTCHYTLSPYYINNNIEELNIEYIIQEINQRVIKVD